MATGMTSTSTDYEDIISKNERIIYVGQVVYKQPRIENTPENKWKGKWDIKYECGKDIQIKENGRIYLIVVNNKIYKIGSSSGKGGIKATFGFYIGGLGGSPSIRTMGIHALIQELLDAGKEVKIYTLFNDPIKVIAYGLCSANEVTTYPDVKVMEDACRVDYKKIYGKYPPWNFQENGEEWPAHIQKLYTEQVNQRKKKDGTTGTTGTTSSVVNLIDTLEVFEPVEPVESYAETWI
jgi:hypothetical protein